MTEPETHCEKCGGTLFDADECVVCTLYDLRARLAAAERERDAHHEAAVLMRADLDVAHNAQFELMGEVVEATRKLAGPASSQPSPCGDPVTPHEERAKRILRMLGEEDTLFAHHGAVHARPEAYTKLAEEIAAIETEARRKERDAIVAELELHFARNDTNDDAIYCVDCGEQPHDSECIVEEIRRRP